MVVLMIKLLIAHVLGDFVFQPDAWVQSKRNKHYRSVHFYLHGVMHLAALLLLLTFDLSYWAAILAIVISHLIVDAIKLKLEGRVNARLLFFLDQFVHVLIIALVVFAYHPYSIALEEIYTPQALLLVLSVLTVTFVSSIIMKTLMSKWELKEDNAEDSLESAGKYIGIIERLFVFAFILLNQWNAIGLLIAAKSVFRFSDLARAKDRKLTEYILIGTLISFGLAITIGLAYQKIVAKL